MGSNRLGIIDALLTDFDRTLVWLFQDPARERDAHHDIWAVCAARGVPGAIGSAASCDPYDLWANSYRWALTNTPPAEAEALNDAIASRLATHEVNAAADASMLEGVCEILEQLKAHRIPVAVVSNNAVEAIWQALKANQAEGLVACVLGREPDRQLRDLKPSPVLLQEALAKLGRNSERALYVGDSVTDMLAGRAAGIRSVGVQRHGRTSGPDLTAAGAERVLDGFGDLGMFLSEAHRTISRE